MDFGSLFDKLPNFIRVASYIPILQRIISRGFSINAIEDDLDDSDVRAFLRAIGARFFPAVRTELQTAAGAASTSPDYVMRLQKLLNQVVSPSPGLDVDGDYGPLTRSAVKAYQEAKGLVVDEFAGDATMAELTADAVKTVPTELGGKGAEANGVAVAPAS